MPPEIFAKLAVKLKRTGCHPTGAGGLRCHYFGTPTRFGNKVRPDAPRSNRWTVSGSLYGKLGAFSSTERGTEQHHHLDLDYACPSWDGDRPDRLCRTGTLDVSPVFAARLRRNDYRWRRRFTSTKPGGTLSLAIRGIRRYLAVKLNG